MDAMNALELGRVTVNKIRTNLWWAFIYNIIGIPLAMGLLLPWTGWLLPLRLRSCDVPVFNQCCCKFAYLEMVASESD